MALRAEKQVPLVYFGRPGALISFPWPKNDISKPYERPTYDFITGSGNHQVSQGTGGSRLFGLGWEALHYDNYAKLEAFHTGMNGPGPFVFLDPSAGNLLPPNVSASGNLFKNTKHFDTPGASSNGVLSFQTDPTLVHRSGAPGNLRWLWGVAAGATPNIAALPMYRSWWGIPALPNQAYTFSFWVRADAIVDSAIDLTARIRWRSASGATLSEPASSVVTANGTWARVSITATSPSDVVYANPMIFVVGTSVTTGASLYLDEMMLEYGSVVNDWVPGVGVKPVGVMGLTDNVPFSAFMRKDVQLQLRELSQ